MFKHRVNETSVWISKLVSTHESGTIIGLPMSGKLRTVETALDVLNLSDSLLIFDLSILPTKLHILASVIRPKLEKFSTSGGQILYLENCSISSKLCRRQLKVINSIRTELGKKFICIFSFNEDITTQESILTKYSYLSSVNQNIFYFPYASATETSELIAQNETRFNVKLSPLQASKVFSETGGVPYLIKMYFKEKEVSFVSIRNLLSGFTTKQIMDLKCPTNLTKSSYQKLGLVNSQGNIISPKISDAISSFSLSSELTADPEKSTLSVGKQKITDELMSYEKDILLKLFHQNKLSREEIAAICYGSKKSSEYSDYAIDKIISRLRLSLKRVGVSPKIIQTNRGFGYSLNNHAK